MRLPVFGAARSESTRKTIVARTRESPSMVEPMYHDRTGTRRLITTHEYMLQVPSTSRHRTLSDERRSGVDTKHCTLRHILLDQKHRYRALRPQHTTPALFNAAILESGVTHAAFSSLCYY
jgi:hypothetical protein